MATSARRRKRVHVEGLGHGDNPIPVATIIGNFVFSGGISGVDRATGEMPAGLDAQVANMFSNVRAVVEAAGCTTGDIAKVTVWLKGGRDRSALNREWAAMFPDPEDVPTRHTMVYDLPGDVLAQCEVTCVLPSA